MALLGALCVGLNTLGFTTGAPLIVRIPGHHRYQLTDLGRRVAVLFTKTYGRVLAPGLAVLDPRLPADLARRSRLATAWRQLERTLDKFINQATGAA